MTAEYVATKMISSRGRMQAHVAAHERWSAYTFWREYDRLGAEYPHRAAFWGEVADLCAP